MKKAATAAIVTLAASPALAHADGAVHMHEADATVWFVLALLAGLGAAFIRRR